MLIQETYKIILLICAILTFSMSVYFWFMPKKALSNKTLGLLTFFWAGALLIFVLQSKAFFCKFPHLYGLATGSILLFFPLLFLFIKSYLDTELRIKKTDLVHFTPIIVFCISYSPFYFQGADVKIEYFTTGIPEWIGTLFLITTVTIIIQGLIYSLLSIYLLQSYKIENDSATIEKRKWLKQFIIANTLLWAIGASAFIMDTLDIDIQIDLFIVYYFGLTTMAIWLGYISIQKPAFFTQTQSIEKQESKPIQSKNSTIEIEELSTDTQKFIHFFETTKPYLDNELSLQRLSYLSGYSRNSISEMLNNQIGKSFYDFINEYRIEEFIKLVNEGMHENHTLTHLYESAGFNSKATFNRFFKKKTGMTPTSYIKRKK